MILFTKWTKIFPFDLYLNKLLKKLLKLKNERNYKIYSNFEFFFSY